MNTLKIAFFTEAGQKRGMGHLIRCYTLYNNFKDKGLSVNFFLDSDMNFSYKFSDLNYFKWTNFNLNSAYDIIFIDSYEADITIYNSIEKHSKVAIYFDDYGRLKYPKGIILNFLPDSSTVFFKDKQQKNTYLLGLDYIPIRKEFLNQKSQNSNQLFIMLGGTDSSNISFHVISALKNIDINKILVTTNEELSNKLNGIKNIKVLLKPTDKELAFYMSTSSIAISTASMTLYELAYFSIPTLIIATSLNQKIGASQLINHNIAYKLIDYTDKNWKKIITNSLNNLIKNNLQSSNQIIDGKGSARIFKEVITKVIL